MWCAGPSPKTPDPHIISQVGNKLDVATLLTPSLSHPLSLYQDKSDSSVVVNRHKWQRPKKVCQRLAHQVSSGWWDLITPRKPIGSSSIPQDPLWGILLMVCWTNLFWAGMTVTSTLEESSPINLYSKEGSGLLLLRYSVLRVTPRTNPHTLALTLNCRRCTVMHNHSFLDGLFSAE